MTHSWWEAREAAYRAAVPFAPVEVRPEDALGATLAAPLVARTAVPGFDCSAMDGFAVGDADGPWRVTGRLLAGDRARTPLGPGDAVVIATGAPVPPGTYAVLPVEHAEHDRDKVTGAVEPGRHIRREGEDIPAGVELLSGGTAVTATVTGLAAHVGLDTVTVRRRPVVAILLTGAELVTSGGSADGSVRDSMGPALPGWVTALGGDPLPVRYVPETGPAALVDAVRAARADVVVTSGGAGGGPADQVPPALEQLGAELVVDTVDCRPGRPMRLATLAGGPTLVALPGNPYAGLVAVLTVLAPHLAGLSGRPLAALPTAPFAGKRTSRCPRIVPVRRTGTGVEPTHHDGPGTLWGAARADAFAVVPPGHRAGDPVELVTL